MKPKEKICSECEKKPATKKVLVTWMCADCAGIRTLKGWKKEFARRVELLKQLPGWDEFFAREDEPA